MVLSMAACGSKPTSAGATENTPAGTNAASAAPPGAGFKVALIASSSSLGDRSFNDGVGQTEMEFTKDLIGTENLAKPDEIKAGIVNGSIKVTDTSAQ